MHENSYTGHCLCKRVRFGFESSPTDVGSCYCSICQHITGSAFGTYVQVSKSELTVGSGAGELKKYEISQKSSIQFCRTCGSTVFAEHVDYPNFVHVYLGALEDAGEIRPTYHEYVGSKAKWFDILDSLPQHEQSVDFES